ncbi:MAG: haloalkane dehalogenase [Rubrobacter sp.]
MEVFRTPEERFEDLPGFPYRPRYRWWRDLRLAHVDEGDPSAAPVVMLHGEPTWSYLYRKVMAPLLAAGHRCVVPDLPGFGRSDKPTDDAWYSYDNHTAAVASPFEELDLTDVTLVGHDWGGPIGLRVATTKMPERVSRFVAMDTRVLTGYQQMGEGWYALRDSVQENPDVAVWRLIRGGCKVPPPPEVLSAYEAPFPEEASKAGVRAFPPMIPIRPDAPGAATGQAVAEALAGDTRPTLLLWADSDPVIPLDPIGRLTQDVFPAADELTVIEDAGHFLQEDQGERIGTLISAWLDTL